MYRRVEYIGAIQDVTERRLSDEALGKVRYSAQPWQETLVAAGLSTLSLSIIATSVLVLWGLRARAS
jgi:hypothetical protein